MGKRKLHPVYQYFTFEESTNSSTCAVCGKSKAGRHAGNLKNHLQSHKHEFNELEAKILEWKDNDNEKDDISAPKKKPITVNLSFDDIKSACVELCSVNGRPFKLMEDSGFRKIIDPLLRGLKEHRTINSSNIASSIAELATKYRMQIKSEMSNKLISIKLDVATKLNRSMLGVNAQYVHESKICLRTLAVKEMRFSHTTEYIKDLMMQILSEYDISPLQLYCCTSDNGANVVKFPELMKQIQTNAFNEVSQNSDDEIEGKLIKT